MEMIITNNQFNVVKSLKAKRIILNTLNAALQNVGIDETKIEIDFERMMNGSYTREFHYPNKEDFNLAGDDVRFEFHSSWNGSLHMYVYQQIESQVGDDLIKFNIYYPLRDHRNQNRILGRHSYKSQVKFYPILHDIFPKLNDISRSILKKEIVKFVQSGSNPIKAGDIKGIIPKEIEKYFNFI